MTVRTVGEAAVRWDLMEVVEAVAEAPQETTATLLPLSPPPTHSFASALSDTPVTLYDDGDASVDNPSALLALPASSDLRPELGDDGDATAAVVVVVVVLVAAIVTVAAVAAAAAPTAL